MLLLTYPSLGASCPPPATRPPWTTPGRRLPALGELPWPQASTIQWSLN